MARPGFGCRLVPWACAVDWPRAPSKEARFLLMMLFPDWRIQQFDLLLMTRMLVALVSVFAAANQGWSLEQSYNLGIFVKVFQRKPKQVLPFPMRSRKKQTEKICHSRPCLLLQLGNCVLKAAE